MACALVYGGSARRILMHVEVTGTAADFMRYDFAEMKDVCKEFLTLVAGILVFSVTFAEKIVGLKGSGR